MRPLGPEEKALWQRVIATVRPLHSQAMEQPSMEASAPAEPVSPSSPPKPVRKVAPPSPPQPAIKPGTTLDASWDRRLARGIVQPDVTVDLHGHGLAAAYDLLDSRLEQAIEMGSRLLLLITGKPPSDDRVPVKRGAIRAAVGDWLAASRHARHIASVRPAHPRHGGAGALYIVIRRRR